MPVDIRPIVDNVWKWVQTKTGQYDLTWDDYLDFYEEYLELSDEDIHTLDGFFCFPDGTQIHNAKLMQGILRRYD